MIRNSARPFLLVAATLICWSTLPAPALADTVSFVGRRDFASGGLDPSSVAVGDFNGDGVPDLAVANSRSDTVSVLLGGGDRTFQAPLTFAVGRNPVFVVVGDFNGDGVPDLAVANEGAVSVLLGNGDGTFQAALSLTAGGNPRSLAVGDFNGDGVLDLAVVNGGSGTVSVLLGNGDGSFRAAPNIDMVAISVAVGDLNGDGIPDLAVVPSGANFPSGANSVSVLLGNGDGTFQAARNFATLSTRPFSAAVGDFNGDGVPDLAVAGGVDLETSSISVLLGNGDGTFQAARGFATGSHARSVAVGDFNGDGVPDLAVANAGSDSVSVLLGNGDGTFYKARNFVTDRSPVSVVVGDFNGDGVADLAVVASGAYGGLEAVSRVSVLLGNGNGTFQAAWNFGAGPIPSSVAVSASVAVSDFNDDGKPDLAVGNLASRNVSVLINNTPPPRHRRGQPLDLLQSPLLTGGAALDVEAGDAR